MARILGPVLRNVEVADPSVPPTPPAPGLVGIAFGDPPTSPGGIVNLVLVPGAEGDTKPTRVSAYFAPTALAVPALADLTPEWLDGNVPLQAPTDAIADVLSITVPGVAPGLYDVYTVIDYP